MAKKKEGEVADVVFEVIHGTVSFSATDVRKVGDEINEKELDPRLKQMLLGDGMIRDTAAPLSPAQVGEKVVDRLIGLAQRLGLITNEGSTYSFAGNDYKGLDALRAAATVDAVETAIADAFAKKQAAIDELTAK
jgi:hypothetical protein